jgi:hypothetical protein
MEWRERERLERAARRKRERREKVIVNIIGTLVVLAIVALVFWLRAAGPCWLFPLKEAPTRCLTIGVSP